MYFIEHENKKTRSIGNEVPGTRNVIEAVQLLIAQNDPVVVTRPSPPFLVGPKAQKMRGTGEDLLHFIHGCLLDPVDRADGAMARVGLVFATFAAVEERDVFRSLTEFDCLQVSTQLDHYSADTSMELKNWAGHDKVTPQQALFKGLLLVLQYLKNAQPPPDILLPRHCD